MYSRSIVIAAMIGVTAFTAYQSPESIASVADRPFEASPDWSLADADGHAVKLSEVSRDTPQLVLFWATWCPYCRALMPHIQSIVMEYDGAIGVLAVNVMDDGDPAAYLEEAGFDFRLLPEGDRVAELYGVKGTPGLILVDTDGNIRFDLGKLSAPTLATDGKKLPHRVRAQRLAPYWASELRKAIDRSVGAK